jgi:hypothetical protein
MPKNNSTDAIADVLREVAMSLEKAIDDGHRSRSIDANDLVETLLAIADRLDPPTRTGMTRGKRRDT